MFQLSGFCHRVQARDPKTLSLIALNPKTKARRFKKKVPTLLTAFVRRCDSSKDLRVQG